MKNEDREYEVLIVGNLVVLIIVMVVTVSAVIGFSLGYQAEIAESCGVVK